MRARVYQKADYPILSSWWKAYPQWKEPVSEALLSQLGLVVEDDEGFPRASGFVYLTNSPIAWIEWVVMDPKTEKEKRAPILEELLTKLEQVAKMHKASVVFTSTLLPRFILRLEERGYRKGDVGMTQLWKGL